MSTNNKSRFTVIISTCDKFSDLWDANIYFLNKNFKSYNEDVKVLLVTDDVTNRKFDGVEIISAGNGTEITERLKVALNTVETQYILFLLDDYFLTEKIDMNLLVDDMEFMDSESVDYLRLYPASKHYLKKEGATPVVGFPLFYIRNIEKGDYKISLYPGLWKTDFMRMTLEQKMNAWQYEVALTEMARTLNAKCAISNHNELPFLDVIRKGKLLNKANNYLKNYPNFKLDRTVMKRKDEFLIWFKTRLRHWLPEGVFRALKKQMIKQGHEFYSDLN